jgi:hypothetical protein
MSVNWQLGQLFNTNDENVTSQSNPSLDHSVCRFLASCDEDLSPLPVATPKYQYELELIIAEVRSVNQQETRWFT